MITVGYSTREHNPQFIEYLKKSSGFKKIDVIEKINNGEKSLSEVYNEILNESKTDIVVLCHDDIYFDTSSWFHKIRTHFETSSKAILSLPCGCGKTFTSYMISNKFDKIIIISPLKQFAKQNDCFFSVLELGSTVYKNSDLL